MKCGRCGEKVVRWPVKGQQEKTLQENLNEGTINWGNMFKMDFMSLSFLVVILFLAWAWQHDNEALLEVYENPCAYCATAGQCLGDPVGPVDSSGQPFRIQLPDSSVG